MLAYQHISRRIKLSLLCIMVAVVSIALAGCVQNKPAPNPPPTKDFTAQNEALKKLFPNNSGFLWVYNGFAEYGHMMELTGISPTEEKTVYQITGEIGDPSGGEAQGDFSLVVTYTIKDGVLSQNKKSPRMMDTFDEVELLRGPLTVNSQWEQKVKDAQGLEYDLVCTITEIKEDQGIKTYSVLYKDKNSDYFERRQLKQGLGVVLFEKKIKLGNESVEMGYYIYEDASGYLKK